MGTPNVLAAAARPSPPPPPPGAKRPSGRHKTISTVGSRLPPALARSTQPPPAKQTVIGPAPTAPEGSVPARRGSGSSHAADPRAAAIDVAPCGSAAPSAEQTAEGRTEIPGNVSRDDVMAAARATIALASPAIPGSTDAPATARTNPVAPPADAPVSGRSRQRSATQPLLREPNTTTDPTRRASNPTRALISDEDAGVRRGTRLHGRGQGLVNAGSESPKLRLVPGKVIPGTRYKILKWLGEGGMGVVYEAAHVDIERRSALKILRFDLSQQPKMVQVFRDEARAASRLGSPHIVEIYDFGDLPDGRLFFAMELIDGHDLVPTDELPCMPAARLIGILRQVCKGLAAAHDAGVVHRDVKPENIIIADTDERQDVAKIVDFGISAMLAAGASTGSGIAGTPHYMAPEQILGEDFDHRLDIYALGATAYELLVGQPPFDADDVDELLKMQVSHVPPAPRTVRPDLEIPAQLETVILRCLAKKADQRYPDMAELEAALCEVQVAAGITTLWDDLAVPDLFDVKRQEQIAARMPSAKAATPKRSPFWPLVAGTSTLAAASLGGFLAMGGPTDAELSIVEQLTAEAKDAAADQSWVVPTATRPDGTTAYSKVLELEAVQGPAEGAADERGVELRERFATSLVASADPMWDAGAKTLARQFYLYALTFDENNRHAVDRLNLPAVALANFLDSARTGDFGVGDQLLASVAAAEAEQNPEKKRVLEDAVIERVQDAPIEFTAVVAQATQNAQIAEHAKRRARRSAGAVASPAPSPPPREAVPTPAEAQPDDGTDDPGDAPLAIEDANAQDNPAPKERKPRARQRPRPVEQDGGSLLGKAKRDPAKAAALAADGMAALKSGQRKKATSLFNQAIAYDRRNAKALMGLADVYFDTGSNQKAINYAEKAVAAAPNSGGYRIRLGDAYFKVLRYQDAKQQYARAQSLGASRAEQRLQKVNAKLGG